MAARDSITPVTFSREEIRLIRQMVGVAEEPSICPRCGSKLQVVGPEGGGTLPTVWHVECLPCRRAAFISG